MRRGWSNGTTLTDDQVTKLAREGEEWILKQQRRDAKWEEGSDIYQRPDYIKRTAEPVIWSNGTWARDLTGELVRVEPTNSQRCPYCRHAL